MIALVVVRVGVHTDAAYRGVKDVGTCICNPNLSRAVGFGTIHAAEAIIISRNHGLESLAFATSLVVLVRRNHSLSSLILRAASGIDINRDPLWICGVS